MRRLMAVGMTAALALALSGGLAGAARGPTVEAAGVTFSPKTIKIGQGEKVTWKNVEGSHTVTFKTIDFDKKLKGNDKISKTFKDTGTFKYICTPHKAEGMKGKVVVGDV